MTTYIHMIGMVLIICIVMYIVLHLRKEGFSTHTAFLDNQAKKYNPIGVSLIASNNEGALGLNTDLITGTVVDKELVTTYDLTDGKSGIFETIKKCEAVTSTDCSAFDDPTFGKDCGLCLDIGTTESPSLNSKQSPSVGGRVVLGSRRSYAESQAAKDPFAQRGAKVLPKYQPTVGTCPANRLVVSKDQCLSLEREIQCNKNANYDLPGCKQCYSDTSYTILDTNVTPGLIKGSGTLNLIGEGTAKITESGFPTQSIQLSSSPKVIILKGMAMTRISIAVSPKNQETPVTLSGYLSGKTTSGQFNIDVYRIVLTDSLTGRKPSTDGSTTVDGVRTMVMTAGFGQSQMNIIANSPFTFVEPLSQESARCKTSPFVTTQAAAEFLDSDPCYKKGSGPGKYSLECLQNSFMSNGCTQEGVGFPSDIGKAAKLMTNADGSFRTIDDIANYVYSQALLMATGVSNGKQMTIENWSAASVFCSGRKITSPCDTSKKTNGPLTKECLSYLWKNQGASNPLGATYNVWSTASSLFSNTNSQDAQFCTSSGTLSPMLPNGQPNENIIKWWQSLGGVDRVKSVMSSIHQIANYQSNLDDVSRAAYISYCYGSIPIAPQASAATSTGCAYPSGTDAKGLCGAIAYDDISLWLDASDSSSLVLSGSTVKVWKDKSDNGYDATGVNGPTLSSNRIVFNGSNQYFTTNYTAKAPAESVFVVYSSNNRLQSSLVESSRPGGRQFQNDGHQGIGFGPGLASMGVRWIAMGTMAPAISTLSLGELLYNSSGSTVFLNGKFSKNSSGNPGFIDGLTVIGGSPGQNGYYLNGVICEVIIYNRVLSPSEIAKIEGRLAWKWNFQTQLPKDHPFYDKSP